MVVVVCVRVITMLSRSLTRLYWASPAWDRLSCAGQGLADQHRVAGIRPATWSPWPGSSIICLLLIELFSVFYTPTLLLSVTKISCLKKSFHNFSNEMRLAPLSPFPVFLGGHHPYMDFCVKCDVPSFSSLCCAFFCPPPILRCLLDC